MNGLPSHPSRQEEGMYQHTQAKTLGSLVDQIKNRTGFDKFKAIGISLDECGALFLKRHASGNYNWGSNFFSRIFATNKIYLPSKSVICFLNRINVVSEAADAVHFFGFHNALSYSRANLIILGNLLGARYALIDASHALALSGGQA